MSRSDAPGADELAFQLADPCEASIDAGKLDVLSDQALTSALNALLRVLAARAQEDRTVNLASGNSRLTATDAVITCTAILESASIEVFELAAWQAMTSKGSSKRGQHYPSIGEAQP